MLRDIMVIHSLSSMDNFTLTRKVVGEGGHEIVREIHPRRLLFRAGDFVVDGSSRPQSRALRCH